MGGCGRSGRGSPTRLPTRADLRRAPGRRNRRREGRAPPSRPSRKDRHRPHRLADHGGRVVRAAGLPQDLEGVVAGVAEHTRGELQLVRVQMRQVFDDRDAVPGRVGVVPAGTASRPLGGARENGAVRGGRRSGRPAGLLTGRQAERLPVVASARRGRLLPRSRGRLLPRCGEGYGLWAERSGPPPWW